MKSRQQAHRRPLSLKWHITLMFAALVTGLILAIIAANSFLLERFYLHDKVQVLEQAHDDLERMLRQAEAADGDISALLPQNYNPGDSSTETEATRYLRQLNETYNINVAILDTKNDRVFFTSGEGHFLLERLSMYVFGNQRQLSKETLKRFSNYTIDQNVDQRIGSSYLESWGYLSDNVTSFIMSMPVASVHEAVNFFNRFLFFIGLLALAVGALVVYWLSRRMARPIHALALLSEKMSALDFSERYEGEADREIAMLGHAMNALSGTLERTIAELKRANNELQLDLENKERLDRQRQEFVANVSHELKTPIALIQGYAEGLQDGMAEDEDSRDYYCGVIVDEAAKMNRMVRQLMSLSSLEQGMDRPEIEAVQLKRLVEGVLLSADILLRQKQLDVRVDIPDNCQVWADEFKLEEVVTNYLNNALNHITAPFELRIYTEELPGEGRLRLHVFNSGRPIPEEDMAHIWEKFYKVDKAHTRSYGGSGLGLSIVKAIAEAHHQSCGVQNLEGGVDFWMSLDSHSG